MTTETPGTSPIATSPPTPHPSSFWKRMVRAARLDISVYEEVEHDTGATGQALAVVLLVGLATGIGSGLSYALDPKADGFLLPFLKGLGLGIATGVIGWLLWSLFAYVLGTTLFKGPETEATYGQLLRTLGFANTPGILRIFAFVPIIGWLIAFVGSVWLLIAGVIAVRQALDFSTWRAIGTCVVGWLLYMLLVILIVMLIGGISLFQ